MTSMDLIALLTDSGLTAREVGEILGTSASTVAVIQLRLRAKKRIKTEE